MVILESIFKLKKNIRNNILYINSYDIYIEGRSANRCDYPLLNNFIKLFIIG